jgi:psiF repeat-containing protein
MKQLITAFALAAAAAGVFAQSASAPDAAPAASKPLTAQQQKMGDCAAANKGKKGDDYKAGVKACLAEQKAAKTAQQQKMSDCAKANKGKKGDDYKAGVKACLAA